MNRPIAILAGLLSILVVAEATPPATMNVQGRVSVNGTNFTGTGQFKFALLGYSQIQVNQAEAAATLTGQFVTGVEVTDGGSGYWVAPGVFFSGGGGVGASATATVSGGQVTAIEVTSAGSGYTTPPTITIDPPPPPPEYDTLWSHDGTGVNGNEPSAAIAVSVERGLYSIQLGDTNVEGMTAFSSTIFENDVAHLRTWFSDGVNGFYVLSPDQRVAAVPYAMQAHSVEQESITAGMIAPQSIGSNQINWAQMPVAGGVWTLAEGTNVVLQSGQWLRVTNEAITTIHIHLPILPSFNARIEGSNWIIALPSTSIAALPNEIPTRSWSSIASSADGEKLVATEMGGRIYCSKDAGNSWEAKENNRKWSIVGSSADGLILVAAESRRYWAEGNASTRGRLYYSTDGGEGWGPREEGRIWSDVTLSSDGMKVVASYGSDCQNVCYYSIFSCYQPLEGRLSISTDSGQTWTIQGATQNWRSVAMSSDGMRIVAAPDLWQECFWWWDEHHETKLGRIDTHASPLYISTDGGESWSSTGPERHWIAVTCSGNGLKMVAANSSNEVYTSSDGGETWQMRLDNNQFVSLASSLDGNKLLAAEAGGWLYTSVNSGTNWTARESNRDWRSVASSYDGTKLAAVVYNGHIYTSSDSGLTWQMVSNYVQNINSSGRRIWELFGTPEGKLRIYGDVVY